MKLVIDIPESTYKVFKNLNEIIGILVYEKDILTLIKAVKNGTPLPKGHGRLVDMSEVIVKLMQYFVGNKTLEQCLDEVHTVIEADGGE